MTSYEFSGLARNGSNWDNVYILMIHTIYIMYTNQLLIEGYTDIQLIYRKFEASQGWKASGDQRKADGGLAAVSKMSCPHPMWNDASKFCAIGWGVQNLNRHKSTNHGRCSKKGGWTAKQRGKTPTKNTDAFKHQRWWYFYLFSCWQIWPAIWMSINEFLMSKRPSWAPPHCYHLSRSVSIYIHWCSFYIPVRSPWVTIKRLINWSLQYT